jgi:hypothetical protein
VTDPIVKKIMFSNLVPTSSKVYQRKEDLWWSSNDPIESGWEKTLRDNILVFPMGQAILSGHGQVSFTNSYEALKKV